ncbi:hypothetical protein SK128_021672 [Halocaridina rubra]|uniref:Uncharacterized protein n=1 Tax=Halocaridina rubra TaxID=373956 RepID=A0AAN8X344_HALRR
MAPDTRGQDDNSSVGSIIAGHRISLNVHYDNDSQQQQQQNGIRNGMIGRCRLGADILAMLFGDLPSCKDT